MDTDEPRRNVGHPARCPLMTDLRQAPEAARAIAVTALGRDPGPMASAASSSHYVYVSPDVVVKIIGASGHSRLDREITLATATSPETLRAECEVREAAYLASDLRVALEHPGAPVPRRSWLLADLGELIVGRYWWHYAP
jgi:hypothetical protein